MDPVRLALEAMGLYVGLPLLFDRLVARGHARLLFPALWTLAAGALLALRADPSFDLASLGAVHLEASTALWLAARTVAGVGVVAALSLRFAPGAFLELPRARPWLWLLIAVLYPLLSVLPQGIVWRVFFAHRYAPIFGTGPGLLVAGAAAFAFAHIVFRNVPAVALTALGGALFLHTYLTTGSMLVSSAEHAVYGVAAFTFGIGRSLRLGTARRDAMS